MRIFYFMLIFALVAANVSEINAQSQGNRKTNLSYTRLTNGLNVPTFEGGRTDFAMNDINDDGHVDILSIGDHGSPFINSTQHGIMVWFNDGQDNFTLHMEGNFGYGGIAVGDVNNDGYKDLGYGMHHNYSGTNFGNQLIEVALGDGTGMSWTPWDAGLATNGETWGMFGTDFGDVNNNGLLDLVSISFGCCAGFHVYLNQGDGSWIPSFGLLGNNSDMIIQFADFNNDGFLDFVAAHALGTAYFGDGTGNFVKNDTGLPILGEYTPRYGVSVGDVNNDDSSGIAFINPNGGVEVYEFNSSTNSWVSYSSNLPASGSYEQTQLFDMNADGFLDVMAFGSQTFQLWLGDGNGNWAADATLQTNVEPGYCRAFRAGGDLNQNGLGDIVLLVSERVGFLNWRNRLYVYAENSTPDSLWIRGLYPKGDEKFYPGSVRFIEWASGVPFRAESKVKIEISSYGPEGPWWLVADSLPNNGKHQWIVPDFGTDECYFKFTVSTQTDTAYFVSQASFTIIGEPTGISAQVSERLFEIVTLIPNPGKNRVAVNSLINVESISFYNLSGQKVMTITTPGQYIDMGLFRPGIYIYQALLENGYRSSGKWIKTYK